mgnify:CR=1 FL=1
MNPVQQSASVAAAIERLREAGFEMELTLKLEIGLRPHPTEDQQAGESGGSFEFTEDDLQVLRSMKIRTEAGNSLSKPPIVREGNNGKSYAPSTIVIDRINRMNKDLLNEMGTA